MEVHKIDRSKKSNRRCANCKHWTGVYTKLPVGQWSWQTQTGVMCPVVNKQKQYWNCCKNFEWNPDKEYIN